MRLLKHWNTHQIRYKHITIGYDMHSLIYCKVELDRQSWLTMIVFADLLNLTNYLQAIEFKIRNAYMRKDSFVLDRKYLGETEKSWLMEFRMDAEPGVRAPSIGSSASLRGCNKWERISSVSSIGLTIDQVEACKGFVTLSLVKSEVVTANQTKSESEKNGKRIWGMALGRGAQTRINSSSLREFCNGQSLLISVKGQITTMGLDDNK